MMLTAVELELLRALVEEEMYRVEDAMEIQGIKENEDLNWLAGLEQKLITLRIETLSLNGDNVDNYV
jgi:hypothetical protein